MSKENQDPANNSGGAGDTGGGAGGDGGELVKQLEALKAEKEKLLAKNTELLGEKKSLSEQLKSLSSKSSEEARKQAEAEKNFEKLYNLAKEELTSLKTEVQSRDQKEQELNAKVVKEKKIEAFKKELGAELVSEDFLQLVNFDEIAVDPSVTDTIKLVGVEKVVKSFKSKFGANVLKVADGSDSQAAKGSKKGTGETFAERAKKLGLG